jgi:hypothetical protein
LIRGGGSSDRANWLPQVRLLAVDDGGLNLGVAAKALQRERR